MRSRWTHTIATLTTSAFLALTVVGSVTAVRETASASTSDQTQFLGSGETLSAGQSLVDTSYRYWLLMQSDGNLVEYRWGPRADVVWSSHTYGNSGATLTMQTDGNLVLYGSDGRAVWATGTSGSDGTVSLSLQTDGNIVVRNGQGQPTWYTGIPSPTLYAGQSWQNYAPLSANGLFMLSFAGGLEISQAMRPDSWLGGWSVLGSDAGPGPGPYSLWMQTDGNLVAYAARGVVWSSGTAGTGADNRFVIQDDGNLVVYTGSGVPVWASGTSSFVLYPNQVIPSGGSIHGPASRSAPAWSVAMQGDGNLVFRSGSLAGYSTGTFVPGSYLRLQADGNLVMYTPSGRAVWSTGTAGAGPNVVLWAQPRAIVLIKSTDSARLWEGDFWVG
ncbi:MAG: hypothetical protein JWM76_2311 [Pseudonocardiales bacterium]|nr:hypothetical protein [Pseudonocardiales bacterium]